MHANESLIARDDTFLGVCQAIGEDFGFNPTWLRLAFAVPVLFAPVAALAAYLALGVIVLLSRLLAPRPRRAAKAAPADLAPAADGLDQYALPMAA
ncbi:MAG TPA: PspC domain-containing protein [Allosphingosinicella sp.]|nr:PspC domain-containing protein [Allosphingosinicella sp.]